MRKICLIFLSIFIFGLYFAFISPNFSYFCEENEIDTTNFSNYIILSENEFYCVNNSSQEVEYHNNGVVTTYFSEKYKKIKQMLVLKNGEIAIFDQVNYLHFFSQSFEHLKSICLVLKSDNSSFNPGSNNLTLSASDIYSNVYVLDKTAGNILLANSEMEYFSIYSSQILSENSKITVLNTTKTVAQITNLSLSYKSNEITLENSPKAIFSDALNNIYVVFENEIVSYNTLLEKQNTKELSCGEYYNINYENGDIFYILNNNIVKIEDFAQNLNNLTPPVDAFEKTILQESVCEYQLNSSANLLKTPFSISSLVSINQGEKVLLLKKTKDYETNFCYVLYQNGGNTTIGYLEEKFLTFVSPSLCENVVCPVRSDVEYYKYPCENSSFKISTLNAQNSYNTTKLYVVDGISFYEIDFDNGHIYVKADDLIESSSICPNLYINTNAKVKSFDGGEIKLYSSASTENVLCVISSNTNVKIINKGENFSEVELILNNKLVRGYVETKYLSSQFNLVFPLTICLFVVSLLTLLIIIFKFKNDKIKNDRYYN